MTRLHRRHRQAMTTRPSKFHRIQRPRRTHERAFFSSGGRGLVAGVDEVGRGAWAGPVVAAAVILPESCNIGRIRDSKQLTPLERRRISGALRQTARYGIGVAEVTEINQYGLSWAVRTAGERALAALPQPPALVLLDGAHDYFAGAVPCHTIVHGDAAELCIAAASIMAKVHRDALMEELDATEPLYGFARHKGYGTAEHQAALRSHGASPHHRQTYAPIQKILTQSRLMQPTIV